jgi:hypothetical protein
VTDVAATADGLARFEARGPCTDAERRAAGWLHDELRAAGHEAWVETHWVRPQRALSLALHATVGVVASVVSITAPLPALIAAAVAALFPLRWLFPRRATQNVLTVPEDDGVALLICAPYAAPRGAIGRRFVEGREHWVAGALLLIAACAGLRLLDQEGLWLGLLQFVPTVFLLLVLAAAGDAAVSPYVSGGEAPASVAVTLYDELRRNPPGGLSPVLLLHGALRAHLRREKPDRRRTVVMMLGPSARLAFASGHPRLRAAATRASEAVGGAERARRRVAARGLPALWIGVPPESATAETTLDFALACTDAVDVEVGAEPG